MVEQQGHIFFHFVKLAWMHAMSTQCAQTTHTFSVFLIRGKAWPWPLPVYIIPVLILLFSLLLFLSGGENKKKKKKKGMECEHLKKAASMHLLLAQTDPFHRGEQEMDTIKPLTFLNCSTDRFLFKYIHLCCPSMLNCNYANFSIDLNICMHLQCG